MEAERPLQVPPICPGGTFTPSDHRSLGSPGHSSCPHAVEITCYITHTVPSERWHLWHTFLCAIPSFVVNLLSTWNLLCTVIGVLLPTAPQFLEELPWGVCPFLLTVEGHQRQPWLNRAVPARRCGNEGWRLVAWMLWADTNALLIWD